jgi:hypothetical protein
MLVRFTVSGPITFDEWLTVQADGPAVPTAANTASPDVHIILGWEQYARLSAGRIAPDQGASEVTGDHTSGASILASLTLTP